MPTPKNTLLITPLLIVSISAYSDSLPQKITQQIPAGYEVMTYESGQLDQDNLLDYLVVLQSVNEKKSDLEADTDLSRPLIIFAQNKDGSFTQFKRNNHVVFTKNQGGQCDPFEEGGGLVIKDHYFTVQNVNACGSHWTDFITFRYVPALNDWVFHKRISESWVMNSSNNPNAEALVLEGRKVQSAKKQQPILFEKYRIE
jgi:hypothetical protein